jgi:hypothetical protein
MEINRVKRLLQNYLDTVVTPKFNEKREEFGLEPVEMNIHDILKGRYQPPIIHIFLDTEPTIKKTYGMKPFMVMLIGWIENEINNFMKIFSLDNKIKIHWNKRPIFNNASLSADD